MPCYYPRTMYGTPGEGRYSYKPSRSYLEKQVTVPCKQCIGCRLAKSMEWGARATHEAQMHKANCFITLTYRDECLPYVPFSDKTTLVLKHFQDFMKRFRERIHPVKIRNLYCGEYGENFGRPHFHAIIFGYDFPDRRPWRVTERGDMCYRSAMLESLWPFGHSEIAEFSFDTACYVARYSLKKQTGKKAESHYRASFDPDTGELFYRTPEFFNMSRDGGIGMEWLLKYKSDVYNHDFVVLSNGKKLPPPKFYDNKFYEIDPHRFEEIQFERHNKLLKNVDNNTHDRLMVREQLQIARQSTIKRKLS